VNRTETVEKLRETLASDEALAIALLSLPSAVCAIHRVSPPTGHAMASVHPDSLIQTSWELDGDPAQVITTGLPVERARIVATFTRAAQAYAVANSLAVEVRMLTGDEQAAEGDAADQVEHFGRSNGPEVDLTDYEPLPESLEALPEDGDDTGEDDDGEAAP
jgi:hypothetical protein